MGLSMPLYFAAWDPVNKYETQTPSFTRPNSRKRPTHIWSRSTVTNILKNETYAGLLRYGKWVYEDSRKLRRRDDLEQIPIRVPAIVSQNLWEAAVAQRLRNVTYNQRNRRRDYLLSGMLVCVCGRRMSGCARTRKSIPEVPYYKCLSRDERFASLEIGRAHV